MSTSIFFMSRGKNAYRECAGVIPVAEILLTADRSVMNRFHMLGDIAIPSYGACNSLPPLLFWLFARSPLHSNGLATFAPYPLRKIESRLLEAGLDVATVVPEALPGLISGARVLGIHSVDPLGLATGPITGFHSNAQRYSVSLLRNLLGCNEVQNARRRGLRVVLGGAGAWQLAQDPGAMDALGIDHVIIGEAERTAPALFRMLHAGGAPPRVIASLPQDAPSAGEIPAIRTPSSSGCIELGRGCGRKCRFCEVTKPPLRWLAPSKIEQELRINRAAGIRAGILHAEDVLLYGREDFIPDREKLMSLFNLAYRYYDSFILTHFSLSAVLARKAAVRDLMGLAIARQGYMIGEAGIETGSDRLLRATMSGKLLPHRQMKWADIVKESLGFLHDLGFMPYCSLIVGLPKEEESDIRQTLDLVDDIKDIRGLLLPCSFTPLGTYSGRPRSMFRPSDSLNTVLVGKCMDHNFARIPEIYRIVTGKRVRSLFSTFFHAAELLLRARTMRSPGPS
jgi:radical SAM superfamily enzyme YgiQ (UPF0313 family)